MTWPFATEENNNDCQDCPTDPKNEGDDKKNSSYFGQGFLSCVAFLAGRDFGI